MIGLVDAFLVFGVGLVAGFSGRRCGSAKMPIPDLSSVGKVFAPNPWIRISDDETVTVVVGYSEMGQGVLTALAQVVADELEADWGLIRVETAPANRVYNNPVMGSQMTVGSTTVSSSWDVLRAASAKARRMLVQTAALRWGVQEDECRAYKGRIYHDASGRELTFGELVASAIGSKQLSEVSQKDPQDFIYIGRRIPRCDAAAKSEGKAVFGIDVRLDDMLTATVLHPPVLGARLKTLNPDRALSVPGVRHVVPIPGGVAVVANTFWQAVQGATKLEITWDYGRALPLSSDDIWDRWKLMASKKGRSLRNDGSAVRELSRSSKVVEAVYRLPFQAHYCAEPMNCTAYVQRDRCEVWAPTQTQGMAQFVAARIAGLPVSRVHVNTTFLGGGFGRRGPDLVAEAVAVSKAVGRPVKVLWTREEDMRNDLFRPASYHVLKAALDGHGFPVAWFHKVVGPPTFEGFLREAVPAIMPDWLPLPVRSMLGAMAVPYIRRFITPKLAVEGSAGLAYSIDNVRVEYVRDRPGVPVGPWRSVDQSTNVFAVESFVDEVASVSGIDPMEFRLKLLRNVPDLSRVLESVAREARWGARLPEGTSRGVSVHNFHGTLVATVAEVSVEGMGNIRVHKVYCAVDCGVVVNPGIVEAQVAGGIAFGLTAAIKSRVTIHEGQVQQTNIDTFPLLRMDEMPDVHVIIMPSSRKPTGIGEVSVPGIAPALANALFSLSGIRARSLPIDGLSAEPVFGSPAAGTRQ